MKTSMNKDRRNRFGAAPLSTVLAISTAMLLGAYASVALLAEDESPATGGLLSAEVPSDLQEALPLLDNNWQEWSDSLGAELARLYSKEQLDLAAQRKILAGIHQRLQVVEASLADARYRSIHSPLRNLYGKLTRRVDVLEAALDTLYPSAKAHEARLSAAKQRVLAAMGDLDSYLTPMKNGPSWLAYLGIAQTRAGLESGDLDAVTKLGERFAAGDQLTDETAKQFLARKQFQALRAAAADYMAVAARKNIVADTPETRKQLAALIAALEANEAQPGTASATAVRQAFSALKGSAADGGERLSAALRANYFNYNFQVVVSEAFINRFVAEKRNETGPVDDFVLGAKVDGNQTTYTDVTFDLKPDAANARFEIKLSGTTNSSTQGVTEQATIFTQGQHHFWANKPVIFNGEKFSTEPARISVDANNYTQGAETALSGIPLFGGLADSIAVGEAKKRKAESEAIARGRVSDKVLPRLNKDVDEKFAQANNDLEAKTNAPLRELGIFPDAKSFQTTESQLKVQTRLMAKGELGAGAPYAVAPPKGGVAVQLHESVMNNSIDRLELAGKTMDEDELKTLFEERARKIFGPDFKFPQAEEDKDYDADAEESEPAVLIFAAADPIRVQISNGLLIIRLRAGIQREDDDDIPTQTITIKLKFSVKDNEIRVEREGGIGVTPVEKPASRTKQLTSAIVMKGIFQRATPARVLNGKRSVKFEGKSVDVNISKIEVLDGWLTIAAD